MKFVLVCWGSRGDIEPSTAVGRELVRRGHDVHIALPPHLFGFAEAAGMSPVAYGTGLDDVVNAQRLAWMGFFRTPFRVGELFGRVRELIRAVRATWEPYYRCREEMGRTLSSLTDGADLLLTGLNHEGIAANVAEYHGIPLATLHYFPLRANGELLSFLPAPVGRAVMRAFWWLSWRASRKAEGAQRRDLGLPKATAPWSRRIAESGSLEIQAYDEACFRGLAAEWAQWDRQRPFVGGLTMDLPADADEEVSSWIAAGTPPIYFGFGSIAVPLADTVAMIGAACAQLGERALVCTGGSDLRDLPHFEHVKVVDAVNHGAIFPACRAVVHHGSAGSTLASLRAGVPTLVLWKLLDQQMWGARVKRLQVGTTRRLATTTERSLVADLRRILAPQYVTRAREVAAQMTKTTESVAVAADLVENFARTKRVG